LKQIPIYSSALSPYKRFALDLGISASSRYLGLGIGRDLFSGNQPSCIFQSSKSIFLFQFLFPDDLIDLHAAGK